MNSTSFVTDTATMCIYDLEALKHRIADDCDWWVMPEDELKEVNEGNVIFVGLGEDGSFEVILEPLSAKADLEVTIRCPSGKVFIGAAEEVTSEGMEPVCIRGGVFLSVAVGFHRVLLKRLGDRRIGVAFEQVTEVPQIELSEPLRI